MHIRAWILGFLGVGLGLLARGESGATQPKVCLPVPKGKAEVYVAWPFDESEAQRRQKETAEKLGLPQTLEINLPKGEKLALVLIPPGEFVMGSPDTEKDRRTERQHRVRITKPFYLSKYVVTQGQWTSLMESNPSLFKNRPDSARRPVEHVSFDQVVGNFLPKLQEQAPQGWSVRLPSEAEWEYSCRAGTATAFYFGDVLTTDQANFDGTKTDEGSVGGLKRNEAVAVGSFAANAWGLYDMHGNVFQWCTDWYAEYRKDEGAEDPCNTNKATWRVLRGGGWIHGVKYCRSAARYPSPPEYLAGSIGFRVVLALP